MTRHGFHLTRERDIPEIGSLARLWRHEATGAELISLENDDENKTFGITFVTPPPDSTGLPHIMEHSVLGGSRKYPVKEPFVELVKGSLHTFVNAMTGPDKTMYPVASQNLQDLRNLIGVYLDAVFFPRISRFTLLQEGWHYEPEEETGRLSYNGIVFNEMKGAYSSPDMLLYRRGLQSLFPDTPCGHDSGGDPARIPDLTYEQYRDFHRTYYQPGNARIWWSGDDDPDARLRLLDEALSGVEHAGPGAEIPPQPRREAPWRTTFPYDAGDDPDRGKHFVTVSWLQGDDRAPESVLAAEVLEHVLVGTAASPLRKALVDSGLGEDLTATGLNDSLRQSSFSVGLKGVAAEDVEKVEPFVLETLAALARNGLDPDSVAASVNTIEFALREQNSGRFPRGLALMMAALPSWTHGGDPLATLAFEEPLGAIKTRLAAGDRLLEKRIDVDFLDNPHRVTVTLVPDPALRQTLDKEERSRLEAAREGMSEDDLRRVAEEAEELKRIQEKPDSPEALATIPTLTLDDLDREGTSIPCEERSVAGAPALVHALPTGGIVYLDVGFDLRGLSADLLPLARVFGRALVETGTAAEDHVRLAQRIGRETGGVAPALLVSAVRGSEETVARLFLRGKATVEKAGSLADILRDVLLTARLDDRERIGQIVREARIRTESGLIPMGHAAARRRLAARYDEAGWVSEQLTGIEQIFFLRRLSDEIESSWPAVEERLEGLRTALIDRSTLLANVTVDEAAVGGAEGALSGLVEALPASGGIGAAISWSRPDAPAFEALTLPSRGNYVVKGAVLRSRGVEPGGWVGPVVNTLNAVYLWERVRVRGGAYSSSCGYDRDSGLFSFLSYRDPNLRETLTAYDGAGAFLRDLAISEGERVKSIIGAIGAIDAPLLADGKGWVSLARRLIGDTDEVRQRRREEVLATTASDFVAFADALDLVAAEGSVVVLGSPEDVEASRGQGDDEIVVTPVL